MQTNSLTGKKNRNSHENSIKNNISNLIITLFCKQNDSFHANHNNEIIVSSEKLEKA